MLAVPLLRINENFELKFGKLWVKCQCENYFNNIDLPQKHVTKFRTYIIKVLDERIKGSYPHGKISMQEESLTGRLKREPNEIMKDIVDFCK